MVNNTLFCGMSNSEHIYSYFTRTLNGDYYHVEELSEHVERDVKLSGAASGEEGRDGEAGADGGEVIIWVHRAAVREVRA